MVKVACSVTLVPFESVQHLVFVEQNCSPDFNEGHDTLLTPFPQKPLLDVQAVCHLLFAH